MTTLEHGTEVKFADLVGRPAKLARQTTPTSPNLVDHLAAVDHFASTTFAFWTGNARHYPLISATVSM